MIPTAYPIIMYSHNISSLFFTAYSPYVYILFMLTLLEKNFDHHFCYNNLVIDTYSKCSRQCRYCYAQKTAHPKFDLAVVESIFHEVFEQKKKNKWFNILAARIPLRIGFLSDPLPSFECNEKRTAHLLQLLHKHRYPYYLITKSAIDEFESILDRDLCEIQLSFSTLNHELAQEIERGDATLASRLQSAEEIIKKKYSAAIRLNLLPQNLITDHLGYRDQMDYLRDLIKFFTRIGYRRFILNEIIAPHLGYEWSVPFSLTPARLSLLRNEFPTDVIFSYCYLGSNIQRFFSFKNHLCGNCCCPNSELFNINTKMLTLVDLAKNDPKAITHLILIKPLTFFLKQIFK